MHFIFLLPSFKVNSLLRISTGQETGILQEFWTFISKSLSSLENFKKERKFRVFSGRGDFLVEVDVLEKKVGKGTSPEL